MEKTIVLSNAEISLLMKAVNGKGGFQTLLRGLQRELRGNTLILTPVLEAKVLRYRSKYGGGGFQGRLSFLRRVQLDTAA